MRKVTSNVSGMVRKPMVENANAQVAVIYSVQRHPRTV
jgi:hypothetical protein